MLSKWFKKYGLQKFKCKLCKRKFLSEDSLQEHIKMIHESNKKSETFIDKNASDPLKIRKEIAKNAISINSQSKNEETANTIEENEEKKKMNLFDTYIKHIIQDGTYISSNSR